MIVKPLEIPDFAAIEETMLEEKKPPEPVRPSDEEDEIESIGNESLTRWQSFRNWLEEKLENWLREVLISLLVVLRIRKPEDREEEQVDEYVLTDGDREALREVEKKFLSSGSMRLFLEILEAPNTTKAITIDALNFLSDEVFEMIIDQMANALEKKQKGMGLLAADFIKLHLDPDEVQEYPKVVAAVKAAAAKVKTDAYASFDAFSPEVQGQFFAQLARSLSGTMESNVDAGFAKKAFRGELKKADQVYNIVKTDTDPSLAHTFSSLLKAGGGH